MNNYILNKYLNNEKSIKITNYTLDSITTLLAHLMNPHKNFKSLHIAGTNGKGSTAFMLSEILQNSGYKTGLYTSPHLININERIKINSRDISDILLGKYLKRIDEIVSLDDTIAPTYFDILTSAAFLYFSDASVDIAIIETGLGGRLDSTNTVIPEISIITDISKDHTNILGEKISEITAEKCGIIKMNIPVITSNTDPGIMSIIEMYAEKNKSELYTYNKYFFINNIIKENDHFTFDYASDDCTLPNIKLPLFPVHQVKNAAVVITALCYLRTNGFPGISNDIIYRELEKIQIPGRFQTLCFNPLIIYDPAHNFDALNNLINALKEYFPGKKKIFIISMMKDKADNKTLGLFKGLDLIYYLLDDQRAYIPGNDEFNSIVSDDNIIVDILKKSDTDNMMIIFTGTFRIYSSAVNISYKLSKENV